MEDVREISAELHRLADSAPSDPLDTTQLLARGRSGRRRRRLLSIGGAVTAVAAIVVGASLIPAGARTEIASDAQFTPVPGVPLGEAGAGQVVSRAEAARRCALRYPNESVTLEEPSPATTRSGQFVTLKVGTKSLPCIVPGGDKPSAELQAELAKDRLPVSAADKLRNCSVIAWVDLTSWQVVATDRSTGFGKASLVAISPSGRKAVECELESTKDRYDGIEGATDFVSLAGLGGDHLATVPAERSTRADLFSTGSAIGEACTGTVCRGDSLVGFGRVASKSAAAVRLRIGTGPIYQVPVGPGGWFTFTWQSGPYKDGAYPSIAAYDHTGKLLKVFR